MDRHFLKVVHQIPFHPVDDFKRVVYVIGEVKEGAFLKIKGVTTIDKFDGELTIGSVSGIKKIPDFTQSRKDTAPEKRVELHCHRGL